MRQNPQIKKKYIHTQEYIPTYINMGILDFSTGILVWGRLIFAATGAMGDISSWNTLVSGMMREL